ncbi:unnamed protein product [Prunus brigantina]
MVDNARKQSLKSTLKILEAGKLESLCGATQQRLLM